MKSEYTTFIATNYPTIASAQFRCESATKKMCAEFPELIRVRGWYGYNKHWWCKTAEGEIVDPTAHQFLDDGEYKEFVEGVDVEPIGKCVNCGDYCWPGAPSSCTCCEICDIELRESFR